MNGRFDRLSSQLSLKKGVLFLLSANVAFFVLYWLIGFFYINQGSSPSKAAIFFQLNAPFSEIIRFPWTLITNILSHFEFLHLAFNLLFLFAVGSLFDSYFGTKSLLFTYFFAGIFGNVLHLLLMNQDVYGASASVMGLFVAACLHQPKLPIMLFGVFNIPIYVLAIGVISLDFIGRGINDQKAHLAHIGGAFYGVLFVFGKRMVQSGGFPSIGRNSNFRKKTNKVRYKSDEEFNEEKFNNQKKIDQILDKISKSGYGSLSKAEKDFLFKQGKS
jgi:membrane associated rhomboid family serine protease